MVSHFYGAPSRGGAQLAMSRSEDRPLACTLRAMSCRNWSLVTNLFPALLPTISTLTFGGHRIFALTRRIKSIGARGIALVCGIPG